MKSGEDWGRRLLPEPRWVVELNHHATDGYYSAKLCPGVTGPPSKKLVPSFLAFLWYVYCST